MLPLQKIFFLLLTPLLLLADISLKHNYYVKSDTVYLSDITNNKQDTQKLFEIPPSRHSLRISSKKLIALLREKSDLSFHAKESYIQFSKKSPIDTEPIQKALQEYMKKHYSKIDIANITITPRSYTESLPRKYSVVFPRKSFLKAKGICSIVGSNKKKIFFNYSVEASLPLLFTTKQIEKGAPLTPQNTQKKSIILQKFHAEVLQSLKSGPYVAKHRLQADKALTQRDVAAPYLVKRGESVQASLRSGAVFILFEAKALQNRRLGESVRIQKSNNKRFEAVVTGKNRVEIK